MSEPNSLAEDDVPPRSQQQDARRVASLNDMNESHGRAKKALIHRFSPTKSTEEHFAATGELDENPFYGMHGHIRRLLDYSYHRHYRKERQWLHDAIIEEFLLQEESSNDEMMSAASNEGSKMILPKEPWLILAVGVHGAGKHHAIRELVTLDQLRLHSFVCIDTGTCFAWLLFAAYEDSVIVPASTRSTHCRYDKSSDSLQTTLGEHCQSIQPT
jgi:hypothetical protein